jgi:hypothetical protein
LCRDETRTSEHIGISPAEEGWTVANDNERYLVAALTCNVLQHRLLFISTPANLFTTDVTRASPVSDPFAILFVAVCFVVCFVPCALLPSPVSTAALVKCLHPVVASNSNLHCISKPFNCAYRL